MNYDILSRESLQTLLHWHSTWPRCPKWQVQDANGKLEMDDVIFLELPGREVKMCMVMLDDVISFKERSHNMKGLAKGYDSTIFCGSG